tara:strand:+ start:43 stop:261 length:219 start_codon:yes stop_codon:yes gene_type:complete
MKNIIEYKNIIPQLEELNNPHFRQNIRDDFNKRCQKDADRGNLMLDDILKHAMDAIVEGLDDTMPTTMMHMQ